MAKGNGQKAQPKNGALAMGGTIRISLLPEVLDELKAGKEVTVEVDEHELTLQFEEGSKNQILELSPWFDIDRSHVSIENSVANDGNDVCFAYMEVDVKGRDGRSFAFTVRPDQAEALGGVLMNFAQANRAVEALRGDPLVA